MDWCWIGNKSLADPRCRTLFSAANLALAGFPQTNALGENLPSRYLTHWGRVTHICVGKLTIIGSDNGLSPVRRQAIIWINAGILLIGPLGTKFSQILIAIQTFSFKKMHPKLSSAKCRPFCLGLNVLSMFNLRLCNAATIWYFILKFGHLHLCGKGYNYFSPHCCKCNSFGSITAIICANACQGPHSDSIYSGSEHRQFNSPRLVKREAGFPRRRRALIGSYQLWRVNDSPYYREYIDGAVQDCSNSIANALELLQSCANDGVTAVSVLAMELLQSCTNPLTWCYISVWINAILITKISSFPRGYTFAL